MVTRAYKALADDDLNKHRTVVFSCQGVQFRDQVGRKSYAVILRTRTMTANFIKYSRDIQCNSNSQEYPFLRCILLKSE